MALRKQIFSLGVANCIDYCIKFFVPIFLVRLLTKTGYADYRMAMLVAGTALAIVSLDMSRSLFYFFPRTPPSEKSSYFINTLFYLAAAGLIMGVFFSKLNLWLPAKVKDLPVGFLSLFVFLMVLTSLIDMLPNADGDIPAQSRLIIVFAFLRSSMIVLAAYLGGVIAVLWILVVYFAIKGMALFLYSGRRGWLKLSAFKVNKLSEQLKYAVPFGIASALFLLRSTADQWIASWALSKEDFAVFSVAAVFAPLISLIRKPVTDVIAPRMSGLEAVGRPEDAVYLSARGNLAVSALSLPILTFAFVYADLMINFVFTKAYVHAAAPMRIYVVGFAGFMVESATIMTALRQGKFVLKLDGVLLILSIALSLAGVLTLGMPGAALGSAMCVYAGTYFNLLRTSHILGKPISSLQPWRAMGKILLASVVGGLFSWLFRYTASSYGVFMKIMIGGIIFVLVYILGLFLLGFLRDIEGTILQRQTTET